MIVTFGQEEVHLRDYLYILRKRRVGILLFFLLALAASSIFTYYEKPLYQSTTTILIERENPNVVDVKEVMAYDASTTDFYQTQYMMLKSTSLAERLVLREDLRRDPYFMGLKEGRFRRILRELDYLPEWLDKFLVEPTDEELFINNMLRVDPVRNSRLVRVRINHPNPRKAADYANSLVDLFIQRNLEERYQIASRANRLISEQLEDLKQRVSLAEKKRQEYKEKHDLVNIPSIREKDEFLQEAKLELVKIQAEEAKIAKRYLPAHPKRIHIRSQIEGLQQKIQEEESKILGLGRHAIEYSELEREAESTRRIYEALLQRLEETSSEAKTQASNVIVVDAATVPPKPFKPRPFLNFLIAGVIGILGGILLAFFTEYLDFTVRIPEDIEKGLGLDLVGVIPRDSQSSRGPVKNEVFFDPKTPSALSESFRALRTAIFFRIRHIPGARVILVTSPNPSEGKTTVCLNLSAAFQQNHLKVLLIDSDLRKPRLHKVLGLEHELGISEVLEGQKTLSEVVHQNAGGLGFDFLSCGGRSHHPTEILGSEKMLKLIEEAKETYDVVIIDSPPYLAVADVSVLSEYADMLVVNTLYQKTDKRHLRNLRRRLHLDPEKKLGIVINQVGNIGKDYYYQQYYYYGYGDGLGKK